MHSKIKWLFVPPAIALLLFLGPLQSGSKNVTQPLNTTTSSTAANPPLNQDPSDSPPAPGSALPQMPGMWQIASTLIGVLLLGVVGIAVLKRAQQGNLIRSANGTGTNDPLRLRQSMRLSQKNTVHAVEFDGALLLVGECDGKLGVLHQGHGAAEVDERTIALRGGNATPEVDDDDDGVVLRDMVIPRPSKRGAQTQAANSSANAGSAKPTQQPAAATAAKLANFKNLLAKAGSAR